MNSEKARYFNRDISWLAFNYRVLQEAANPKVPLLERLKFMAIYSNNLDEFYRVRVASILNLVQLKKKQRSKLSFVPEELLQEINTVVDSQQKEFGSIYRDTLLPSLKKEGIELIDETGFSKKQLQQIEDLFEKEEEAIPTPIPLELDSPPFLENKKLYFFITTAKGPYYLCPIPTDHFPRFIELESSNKNHQVCFLDDALRAYLMRNMDHEITGIYAIKMSRDAELYIGDEFSGNLVEKIRKQVEKRDIGLPTRFLYDSKLQKKCIHFLCELFLVPKDEMIPGGKYHNFSDLFQFPSFGRTDLENVAQPALSHKELEKVDSYFDYLDKDDAILHFPYQRYDYVIEMIQQAAEDSSVREIDITLYRVSDDSAVCKALIKALKNGIKVTAFIEMKARFDEASNYKWSKKLEKAGARVIYSMPDLKVHSKVFLITRKDGGKKQRYAYFGTGNFNEKTARIYGDIALLTSDKRLTKELVDVFKYLKHPNYRPTFKNLLVSPFNLRRRITRGISNEIKNAEKGLPAFIIIKINNLEDEKIIDKLYEASQAGVKVQLIVRGICRLIPGVKGLSENISVISIVDRYLEHTRVFWFHDNGKDLIFSGSADMMKRNLNHRVEVIFPIIHQGFKKQLKELMLLQLSDNQKARIVQPDLKDKINPKKGDPIRCQEMFYHMLKEE